MVRIFFILTLFVIAGCVEQRTLTSTWSSGTVYSSDPQQGMLFIDTEYGRVFALESAIVVPAGQKRFLTKGQRVQVIVTNNNGKLLGVSVVPQ